MPVVDGSRSRGRPQLVSSEAVVAMARRMLSAETAADFTIRRLADALSVAPATIHARFGTKEEVLALAYLQQLAEIDAGLRRLKSLEQGSLEDVLRSLSGPLTDLRNDFALRFELAGGPAHGVRSETWRSLRGAYLRLVGTVYGMVRDAAAREGVRLTGGTLAERFVWSVLSVGTSQRNADVFGHGNARYFRFLARSIRQALGPE